MVRKGHPRLNLNPCRCHERRRPLVLAGAQLTLCLVLTFQRYTRIQEFEVLGQTTLSSLKDQFSCLSDHVCHHNFAEDPDDSVGKIAKVCYWGLIRVLFFFVLMHHL